MTTDGAQSQAGPSARFGRSVVGGCTAEEFVELIERDDTVAVIIDVGEYLIDLLGRGEKPPLVHLPLQPAPGDPLLRVVE